MSQSRHASRTPRRDARREKRRAMVAELYVKGWTQAAIAERLGVTQPAISKYLKLIRERWRESQVRDFDEAVARELEKMDRVEREAWEAWERSKQPQESTTVTDGHGGKRAQKRVQHQYGDPRYLDQIQKCIGSRRALLGLDAPERVSLTSPDGEHTYHSHVMAELMRLAEKSSCGPVVIDAAFIEQSVEHTSLPASESPPNKVSGDHDE